MAVSLRETVNGIDVEMVPSYRLDAARAVLAEREAELLELKGPCRAQPCRLHMAHRGPCVQRDVS